MLKDPTDLLEENRGQKEDETVGKKKLPATTPLSIDVLGVDGKRYAHTFTYTVPNLGRQVELARLKAGYLPHGAVADPNGAMIVEQVCYLTITLDKDNLPSWWKPWELFDATPISALYKEATSYEARFHGRAQPGADTGEGQELDQGRGGQDTGGSETPSDAPLGDGAQPPAQRRKTLASS